jgi:DNA-binding MarR family transcriptional regulator
MSEENVETTEDKKAKKAELKTAKKAKKAAKEQAKLAEKTAKKAERQKRKAEVEASAAAPEIKQIKPAKKSKAIASSALSIGAKLQSVARQMRANLASQFLEHGLYAGQEQVLFLLDEFGPLSLVELAEKLDVRAPTITKTVTRMEAQGFLSRAVSRDDARSIIITLTPDGRRVLKTSREIVAGVEAKTFSALSAADCETLAKNLDLVFSHMKAAE